MPSAALETGRLSSSGLPLPGGSALNATQGVFTWQPGAGFVGGHDFVFVRTDAAGGRTRIPVHVTIGPKFSSKNRVL